MMCRVWRLGLPARCVLTVLYGCLLRWQAVYSPSDAANRLSAAPRLLLDAAANFQTGQEEVTLSVSRRQLGLRNYTDDEPGTLR